MGREISIQNSRLFKHPLTINEIIGDEDWNFGTIDSTGCIVSEIKEEGWLTIFDPSGIGRGIQVLNIDSKEAISLLLPVPATESDVRLLYAVAQRIAGLWKSKSIKVEEDVVNLADIGRYIEYDLEMNRNLLGDAVAVFKSEWVRLFCATLPIEVPTAHLESFRDDYQGFGEFLHDKQKLYPFYSYALYWTYNEAKCAHYLVIDDYTILPKEPNMHYDSEGKQFTCAKAFVVATDLFPDEQISRVEYNEFLCRIPDDRKSEFDMNHIMISPLSKDELRHIFKE